MVDRQPRTENVECFWPGVDEASVRVLDARTGDAPKSWRRPASRSATSARDADTPAGLVLGRRDRLRVRARLRALYRAMAADPTTLA